MTQIEITPDLPEFIQFIKGHPEFGPAIIHHRFLPPDEPLYGQDFLMPEIMRSTLPRLGIENLFIHQTEAIGHIRRGANVLVATPTASGKSLIYNLTVLERLLEDETSKALYLFPLKALEQDQLKKTRLWLKGIKSRNITAQIYDGDTSTYLRKKIKSQIPEIIMTNPDMLHRGILAYHEGWKDLFEHLSFVILDEVHTYRGIFGSHVSQIIKRLKRICGLYGRVPRFILLSATVDNPKAFGESLIQEKVEVVDGNGAPRSGRHFMFMNPYASPNFSAARLFLQCIQSGFRTIAFTQSRKVTELIHVWVSQLAPRLKNRISSYRAGFMPEERREIEGRLASGELLGVVSTSALEMGIDIGFLDICILVGYPGTIINTWQRGGRVGRAGRDSLIIFIAKPDALDQYFMKHPDDLLGRSYEAAILDPHNPHVVEAHLPCAASEDPITLEDERFWGKNLSNHLENLELEGTLSRSADGNPTWYASRKRPHMTVNIRSLGESYTIFESSTGQAIGTVDGFRAFKECHPGAVYLHRARHYLVDHLDLEKNDIIAGPTDLNYFTRSRTDKDTEILETYRSRPKGQFIVREGKLKVTEQVTGFEKRALPGQELMGVFPLDLPSQTFETIGFWFEIEPVINRIIEKEGLHFMGGIHAIEHGAIGIFPLFALCDRNDVGGISYSLHPQLGKSAIFIYDGHPGGVGLAQRGFDVILDLLEKTLEHIRSCECEEGCPSCIHSPKCGSGNKPLDKRAAVMVLECLLGQIPLDQFEEDEGKEEPLPDIDMKENIEQEPEEPRVLYFDLETQKLAQEVGGWKNIHLMRLSVAVVYDSYKKEFLIYPEDKVDDLLTHLEKADLVVGFNVKRFDYRVLSAYTTIDFNGLNTFDMLESVFQRLGFRLSLDHLAQETLDVGKSADGLQAVEWFRQGEFEKLSDYCRQDVRVTRDLFLHGVEKGHLIYRLKKENRRVRLPVDWKMDDLVKVR